MVGKPVAKVTMMLYCGSSIYKLRFEFGLGLSLW